MRNVFLKCLMFLTILFCVNSINAQDIITLKNGDEIKSKVIEVTPDLVKYKNWTNQDGPTYSLTKAEIFMIKYQNGTKDVFKETSVSNSAQNNNDNNGSKFIGTWYHKRYDGNNNKTTLTISKPGVDFLVDYKQMSRSGGFDIFFNTDGSFKEMARLDGNSIVINSFIKLSLMNDNTILMNSEEFVKTPVNIQTNTSASSIINAPVVNNKPSFTPRYFGDLKDGKKEGYGTQLYEDGSTYKGEWKDDMRNGKGVLTNVDSTKIIGVWKNNQNERKFKIIFGANVYFNTYEGEMYNDKMEGIGVMLYYDGSRYEGDFKDNQFNGNGVLQGAERFGIATLSKGIFKNGKIYNGTTRSIFKRGKDLITDVNNGVEGVSRKVAKEAVK